MRKTKKRRTSRRTVVIEYDNNAAGQKFPVTTTKKVIKRKRKSAKKRKTTAKRTNRRRAGCSTRSAARQLNRSGENDGAAAAGVTASGDGSATLPSPAVSTLPAVRRSSVVPRLHLFGDPNALEYFSDEHDMSDENAGRGLGGGGDGGLTFAATFARSRIAGPSVLHRQKRVLSALNAGASAGEGADMQATDVLSNILETMDRWHSMTKPDRLKKIRIDADGKLSVPGAEPKKATPTGGVANNSSSSPNGGSSDGGGHSGAGGGRLPEVMNAPRYPRGGGRSGGGGGNGANQQRYQSSGNNGQGGGGGGGGGFRGNDSTGMNGGSGGGSVGSGMSFSIFGPRNSAGAPMMPGGGNGGGVGGDGPDDGPYNNNFNSRNNRRSNINHSAGTAAGGNNSNFSPAHRFQPLHNQQRGFCDANNMFVNSANNGNANRNCGGGGGLYDDPGMPAPMLPITSLPPPPLMIQPPPIAHPPPAFNPSVMLQQQQPHFMPAYRALPPVHIVQHPPPLFETPPPAIVPVVPAVAVEMPVAPDSIPADQYDPTVDSEEPDDGDSALNTSLDIPLPINEAPETAALTKAPKATDDAGTVKISSFGGSDNDESSSSDDCPNFSVYSAESMNVARNLDQGSADRGGEHAEESTDRVAGASTAGTADDGDEMERDEDLVQLDDDDDDNMVAETAEEKLTEDEAGEHEKSLAAAAAKKNVLDLHDDSDWEELNHERSGEGSDIVSAANDERTSKDEDADAQAVKKPEDTDKRHERSYTPCLDEQMPVASEASDDAAPVTGARKNKSDSEDMVDTSSDEDNPSGIAGMQTELISDDDEVEDILNGKSPRNRNKSSRRRSKSRSRPDKKTSEKRRGTDDAQTPRKRSHDRDKEKAKKAERDEAFKKLSRSNRDRNYRDKKEEKRGVDNSSHRRRTRSRSHNKENRTRDHAHKRDSSATRRRDTKRKDMERYDVRNVIAERQPRTHKDQYGRDTSRPRSRSLSRHRRRAAAAPHSRSRSRRRSPATPRADRSRRRVSVHRSRRSRSHSPAPPISANNAATHRSRRASRSPLVARPDGVTPAAAASRSHRPHRSTSSNRLNGKSSRNHSQQQSRHRSPSISHASPTHGACASTSRQRQHQNNAATVASRRSHSRTPGKAQKKAKRSKTRKRKLSPDPTSPARDKHHTSGSHHHAEYPQRQFMEDPHSYHVPPDKKPTYSHDCTRSPSWDRVESSANPTTAPSIPVASTSLNASAGADGKYEAWDAHSDRLSPWTRSPTPVSPEPMSSSWTPPQALQHMHSSAPATASSLHHHSHKKAVLNPTSGVGENLTVILKNKEAASSAKRSSKKSKKRRSEKHGRPDASPTRRERRSKRDKAADHYHHHLSASSKTGSGSTQPSKEVFASGDNILVSVSFNKDKTGASGKPSQQTTIVTLPVSKELIGAKKSSLGADGATTHSSTAGAKSIGASTSRRSKKSTNSDAQPHKHHSHQHQRHKKRTDLKPVAIIDLDRSPFKEITPSPRDIIILDSDTGGSSDDVEICSERRARSRSVGKSTQQSQQPPPSSSNLPPTSSASSTTSSSSSSASSLRMPNAQLSTERRNIAQASQPQSPAGDSEFDVGSGGPKTPPEPIRKSVDSVVCPVVVATATSTTTTALSSLVKFSLPLKNKLRAVNPLHEALDEESSPTQQPAQQPSLVQLQQAQPQSQSQHDLNAPDAITQQTQSSITASSSDADNILPSIQDVSTEVSTSSTAVQDLQQPDADHISAASQEKATTSASSSSSSSARSVSPAVQPKNANHKIGPNTPPESGPCSPDAYNPFEPTESANASPQSHSDSVAKTAPDGRQSQQSRNSVLMTNDNNGGEQQQHCNADDQGHGSHTPELPSHATQELASDDKNTSSGVDKSVKPVDLALALINSKASLDAANSFLSSTLEGGVNMTSSNNAAAGTALSTKTANNNAYDIPNVHCIDDDDDDDDDNGVKDDDIAMHSASKADHNADKYDDVHQSWPTNTQSKANVQPLTVAALKQHLTPLQPSLKTSRFINSISSGSGSLISKLPMPPKSQSNSAGTGGSHSKLSLAGGSRQKQRQNGGSNDDSKVASTAAGHESPYSPDSSDYDDLFEPPPISPGQYGETGGSHSQQHGRPSGGSSRSQHQQSQSHRPSTADVYEDLFGSTSPVQSQHLRQFGNRHPATGAGGNKRSSPPPSHGAGPSNTRSRAKPIALPGRGSYLLHYSVFKHEINVFRPTVASTTPVAPLSSHLSDDQQRLFDEIPGSAVEMHAQDQVSKSVFVSHVLVLTNTYDSYIAVFDQAESLRPYRRRGENSVETALHQKVHLER